MGVEKLIREWKIISGTEKSTRSQRSVLTSHIKKQHAVRRDLANYANLIVVLYYYFKIMQIKT